MSILSSTCAGKEFLRITEQYLERNHWVECDSNEHQYIHADHPGFRIVVRHSMDNSLYLFIEVCRDLINKDLGGSIRKDSVGLSWQYDATHQPAYVCDFEDYIKKIM